MVTTTPTASGKAVATRSVCFRVVPKQVKEDERTDGSASMRSVSANVAGSSSESFRRGLVARPCTSGEKTFLWWEGLLS